jgi:hypothetical protein
MTPRTRELHSLMKTLTHIRGVEQQNRTVYGALDRQSTRNDGGNSRPLSPRQSRSKLGAMRYRMEAVRAFTGQRRLVDADKDRQTAGMRDTKESTAGRPDSPSSLRRGETRGTQGTGTLNDALAETDACIFTFTHASFKVSPDWKHAYATVVRQGSNFSDVRLTWATVEGSSTSSKTLFKPTVAELLFEAGGPTKQTVKVPLTGVEPPPDSANNFSSAFQIQLLKAEGPHALLSRKNKATIRVISTKAPPELQPSRGILQFVQAAVTCSEHVGILDVEIERVEGMDGTLSLSYRTVDGTAVANVDYIPVSGTVTFAPYETSQMLQIEIKASTITNHDVEFSIELARPSALSTELTGEAPVDVCEVTVLDDNTWHVSGARRERSPPLPARALSVPLPGVPQHASRSATHPPSPLPPLPPRSAPLSAPRFALSPPPPPRRRWTAPCRR